MSKHVEDVPNGTPYTHSLKHDDNVPELHDESIEEDSEEEEFSPEEVTFEPSEDSRFSSRGPTDPRAVSLSTARRIQEDKNQGKNNQSQSNSQTVSQKPSSLPPRHVDAKRYASAK